MADSCNLNFWTVCKGVLFWLLNSAVNSILLKAVFLNIWFLGGAAVGMGILLKGPAVFLLTVSV